MSRNRNCRIFQDKTALEIARTLLQEQGFSDLDEHLFVALHRREYCVQFNESDFDFISRLFEYEGIYYYFKHELNKHTLVLADSISAHDPTPGFEKISYKRMVDSSKHELGCFHDWFATKQVLPGRVKLDDYNFKMSRANISAEKADPKAHAHADSTLFFYPGYYQHPAAGMDNATVRLEEAAMPYDLARGVSDAKGLSAGALFTLEDHPRKDQNKEYLIVSAQYDMDAGTFRTGGASQLRMTTSVTALDSKTQFRPVRATPVPFVTGPQTARVVGPKSSEVWTDEFGRVKVQFPWDQLGKNDENSSCWIRVSQAWAGAGWGSMHVPRIGQEVLVDFLDGDLDRPIIIGRVYNDRNPVPYPLPESSLQSGIKSHSEHGGKNDFNELRFDDTKKAELIRLRAQKDLRTLVRHDSTTSIGHDHTHTVKNKLKVTVEEGDYNTQVTKGVMLNYVPDNLFDVCAKEIVETADEAITFRVKEVSIRIDDKSISLNVGEQTEIKLELATLKIISPKVDINPMGGKPAGPADIPKRPEKDPPQEDSEFKGGGGSFGGGGSSGSW